MFSLWSAMQDVSVAMQDDAYYGASLKIVSILAVTLHNMIHCFITEYNSKQQDNINFE